MAVMVTAVIMNGLMPGATGCGIDLDQIDEEMRRSPQSAAH
jgi:hypothetical protein